MRRPSFLWLSPTLTAVGKKFGIDAHYYAKNSTLVLLGQFVDILRGLATGYLVARFFQQEMYGTYQFILSILGMLSIFGLPQLATSVTRAWARGEPFTLKRLTLKHFAICLIASLLLLGCIPFLSFYNRAELWPLFLVAALLFPLAPIAQVHFGAPTQGRARFDVALKANIAWSIIMIAATLLILTFHQSVLLMLIANMALAPCVYLFFSRDMHPPKEEGNANTGAILRYGWRLTFASIPVNLVWYIDKLLISHLFGLSQLAVFSVALLIPEQVKQFSKQLLPVSFPKQARGTDSRERRIKLMKAVLVGTAVFAAGISIYAALCPILIPFLFPQYNTDAVIRLTILASTTLIFMPSSLFAQYLEARSLIREIQYTNWLSAIVFGIALFILTPLYGLAGAILSRGIFRLMYTGLSWWFVMRAPLQLPPPTEAATPSARVK